MPEPRPDRLERARRDAKDVIREFRRWTYTAPVVGPVERGTKRRVEKVHQQADSIEMILSLLSEALEREVELRRLLLESRGWLRSCFPEPATPFLNAIDAALSTPAPPEPTHGRHCSCSACAAEDWTRPDLAPCGMHGSECPNIYAPAPPNPEAK